MSLLQEMQQHGLADCEFNRTLTGNQTMKKFKVIARYSNYCEAFIAADSLSDAHIAAAELDGGEFSETDGAKSDWEIYQVTEMQRELTADEKAFARAVDSNGGFPSEAVIAFILSEDSDEFYDGEHGEYYSSLQDMSNVFYSALEYARGK
jgi:hypothetical protein